MCYSKVCRSREKTGLSLYYLNSSNDLEPKLMRNLLDAEQVGSTDQVIWWLRSRAVPGFCHPRQRKPEKPASTATGSAPDASRSESHPTRGLRKDCQPVLSTEQALNAGEVSSDFISWGIKNYPAKNTWSSSETTAREFRGTGFWLSSWDMLDLPELKSAPSRSARRPRSSPMCSSSTPADGSTRSRSQLRDEVGYMVASEEIIPVPWAYPPQLSPEYLSARPSDTPPSRSGLGPTSLNQDTWDRLDNDRDFAAVQLSAIEMKKVAPLEKALDQLAQALIGTPLQRFGAPVGSRTSSMDEGGPARPRISATWAISASSCKCWRAPVSGSKRPLWGRQGFESHLVAFHNDGGWRMHHRHVVYLPDGFARGSQEAAAGCSKTDLAARAPTGTNFSGPRQALVLHVAAAFGGKRLAAAVEKTLGRHSSCPGRLFWAFSSRLALATQSLG